MVFDFLDKFIINDESLSFFTNDLGYEIDSENVFDEAIDLMQKPEKDFYDTINIEQNPYIPYVTNKYRSEDKSDSLYDFYDIIDVNNIGRAYGENAILSYKNDSIDIPDYETENAENSLLSFMYGVKENNSLIQTDMQNELNLQDSFLDIAMQNANTNFITEHSNILETISNEEKEFISKTEESFRETSTAADKMRQSIGINPVINISFGDVHKTADVNVISEQIRDMIVRELMASCEGIY